MTKNKKETRASRNIKWIEDNCMLPDAGTGNKFVLQPFQKKFLREIYDNKHGTRTAILSIPRKNGKGLALDTFINTPAGFKTMGDLRAGDYVFGSDGKPTRVKFVSDVHYNLKCYRLTFSDGTEVVADEEHRWLTTHSYRPWVTPKRKRTAPPAGKGKGGDWVTEVITTPQIAMSVRRPRNDGGLESNHKLPVAPQLITPDVDLPIDPYLLGIWLGDGTSAAGNITVGKQDVEFIADQIRKILGHIRVRANPGRAFTICTPKTGFHASLKQENLLKNKHIPEAFLTAGTAQRWALLQGLMDSDGTVARNGGGSARCSFSNTNGVLAYGVWMLARSLGLKATFRIGSAKIYNTHCGMCFNVDFPAHKGLPVFRLARKQDRLPEALGKRSGTLTIISCEPVESVPTVCIQVEAEDSLFLVGQGNIATHNTALVAAITLLHLVGPEYVPNGQIISAAQSLKQAGLLFEYIKQMVEQSPSLRKYMNITAHSRTVKVPDLGTSYRSVANDPATIQGASPVLAIVDELGQTTSETDGMYNALNSGQGAHDNPLMLVISTQAESDSDALSILIDNADQNPRTVSMVYSLPMDSDIDIFSEKAMKIANPGYGKIAKASVLKDAATNAKLMPSLEADYRNKHLNQRIASKPGFISRDVWMANGKQPEDWKGKKIYAALDLSVKTDLTSLTLIHQNADGKVWSVNPYFWLPAHGLKERGEADRINYQAWVDAGKLFTSSGKTIDYDDIAEFLWEVYTSAEIVKLVFDRWNTSSFTPSLRRAGFGDSWIEDKMFPFGQGFRDMTPAIRELEAMIVDEKLCHGNHPVLTYCLNNVAVISGPADGRKFDKKSAGRRIDGAITLTMCAGVIAKDKVETKPKSYLETSELLVL